MMTLEREDVVHDESRSEQMETKLRHGRLANGLTYYVRSHPTPKDRVELRLVVRVGSLVEEDFEQGLAHFTEHMGFKGTENFNSGEMVSFLESIGASFGADVNAHTGMEETVYRLHIPLTCSMHSKSKAQSPMSSPLISPNLEKGFLMLSDWAFKMCITDEDVESERTIIEEEWRSRHGPSERILQRYWKKVFGKDNQYGKRMPIGKREVFMHCKPAVIREFYQKWYRPEFMSVVAVGDFDCPETLVDMIQQYFSTPEPHHCKDFLHFPLPQHTETLYASLRDPELTSTSVSIEFFEPLVVEPTLKWLKSEIVKRVFSSVIDHRLALLSKENKHPPFLTAGLSIRPIVPKLISTSVHAEVAHGSEAIEKALGVIMTELQRMKTHGFLEEELVTAVSKWTSTFTQQLRRVHHMDGSTIASEFVQHFLHSGKTLLMDEKDELKLSLELLEQVTLADLKEFCQRFQFASTGPSFCVVSVQEPESNLKELCNSSDSSDSSMSLSLSAVSKRKEQELKEIVECIYDRLQKEECLPWLKSSISPLAAAIECIDKYGLFPRQVRVQERRGRVKRIVSMSKIGAEHYELENGIRVCLKPSKLKEDCISFQAFALRGSSELNEVEDAAMSLLSSIADESGLGNLSGIEMSKLSSSTHTRVNTQKHFYHRGLGGSCPKDFIELLMQILHLKLVEQPFHEDVFERHVQKCKVKISQQANCPHFHFETHAQKVLFGDVPHFRPLSHDVLQAIQFEDVKRLYHDAFLNNPTEFTFVFVGDLPELASMKDLIEIYLGSLQAKAPSCHSLESCVHPLDQNEDSRNFAVCRTMGHSIFRCRGLPMELPVRFPQGFITEVVEKCLADKSSVTINFYVEVPEPDLSCHFRYKSMCQIAQLRLMEVLRREMGGVYNVGVDFTMISLAKFAMVTIGFNCSPTNEEAVIASALKTVRELSEEGPSFDEIQSIQENFKRQHEMALKNDSYWLFWILDSYKHVQALEKSLDNEETVHEVEGHVLNSSLHHEKSIESLSSSMIQDLFKKTCSLENCVVLSLSNQTKDRRSFTDGHLNPPTSPAVSQLLETSATF